MPRSFARLAERTRETAPDADIYYLQADMVLAGLDRGVNMVELVRAVVPKSTRGRSMPIGRAAHVLRRLIDAGCDQITSNDPDVLTPLVAEIAACS